MRKGTTSDSMRRTGKDAFIEHVEEALKYYADPRELAEQSPLATPYFLGRRLEGRPDIDTPRGRWRVLQQVLLEAANGLTKTKDTWPMVVYQSQSLQASQSELAYDLYIGSLKQRLETGSIWQRILFWAYFNVSPRPSEKRSSSRPSPKLVIESAKLGIEPSHYHRRRGEAVQHLAVALLQLVQPALRLETSPTPVTLVGRTREQRSAEAALRQRKTISITGPGGIGKTALAGALAAKVAPQATFWFTVRLGVNDNRSTLLYELAYFLANHGSGNLWRSLVAADGKIPENAPAVLRYDLNKVEHLILLCIDEVDLLRPLQIPAHRVIFELIHELRNHAPLLLVGQQLEIAVDDAYSLEGLQLLDVHDLLNHVHIDLDPQLVVTVHHHAQGNPRMLELFLSLHHAGEQVEETLGSMEGSISLGNLLARVILRLSDTERQLLQALSVYRSSAPEDIWHIATLQVLLSRRLVQREVPGGVSVVPVFRPIVYAQLASSERRRLHRDAAEVREARAEYTAAAYHYLKADLPEAAFWTWHAHRFQEIQQGQGGIALSLLSQIPVDRLSTDDQRDLAQAISELELLGSQLEDASKALARVIWPPNDMRTAQADRTRGHIYDLQSRLDQARESYRDGLRTVERLSQEAAIFHKNLSWVAIRQRNLDEAWDEACRARYEAVNMQGYVQEELEHYAAAHTYYVEALALAQQCRYLQGEAKTYNNLTRLTGKLKRFDEAFQHALLAARLFRQIGDLAMMASVQVNLALAYNQAHRPSDAIPPAQEALEFFMQSGQAWGKTAAAQNLAEAYLELQELDKAADYAQIVIETNEPKTLPDGLRALGEIELARGRMKRAARLIRQSIDAARRSKDLFLEGYAWRALGRVLLAQGKPRMARVTLDHAIAIFQQLHLEQEVIVTTAMWQLAQSPPQSRE